MKKILFIFSLIFCISTAEAAYLDLTWDPNQEPDLAGYRLYYGTTSGEYINFVDIGLTTTYRLNELLEDVTFYIAITAYDLAGNESDFSDEVSGVAVIDESALDQPEYGIGGEPTEVDSPPDKTGKTQKSTHGSERGRKLGWKK